jgi:hypothetical protein
MYMIPITCYGHLTKHVMQQNIPVLLIELSAPSLLPSPVSPITASIELGQREPGIM